MDQNLRNVQSGTVMSKAATPASLLQFFLLAFAVSWTFWGLAIAQARGLIDVPLNGFGLMILGGLGPMIAAVIACLAESGWSGVCGLFRQLLRWRVGGIWYVVLAVILAARLLPLAVPLLQGHQLDWSGVASQLATLPIIFVFIALVGGGLDEEAGWRGFALGRLQALLSPLTANLLLGVIWACWHLPLWLIPGTAQSEASFAVYLVSTVSLSIILGWIYNGTGQSLLLVVLAHAVSNTGDNLRYAAIGFPQPTFQAGVTEAALSALFFIWAAFVIWRTGGRLGAP
jgi:uncharacterized protein